MFDILYDFGLFAIRAFLIGTNVALYIYSVYTYPTPQARGSYVNVNGRQVPYR